jgi:hypothetical protein
MQALEQRHLADLTFRELSQALRSLSSTYVERRRRLQEGAALSGAGKRAAFALFYGPLHYLLVREIVRAIPGAATDSRRVVDLGCGTGAAGAAWASACTPPAGVLGIDCHPWTIAEAAWTYRTLGLSGRTRRSDIAFAALPDLPASLIAAFTLNELSEAARDALKPRLFRRVAEGSRVLIVEPLAGAAAPWWDAWRRSTLVAGGRADEWRFRIVLPAIVARLDRASGLNHVELTGRSLWLARGDG